MGEHLVILELGVVWEPNAPQAVMLCDDLGRTALALQARGDDDDERCVVLQWAGVRSATLAGPNDEAAFGHRLWEKGLNEVLWVGRVVNSELVRGLEHENRVHPRHDPHRYDGLVHEVVLLKEGVAEVVGESLVVRRLPGSTLEAGARALRS